MLGPPPEIICMIGWTCFLGVLHTKANRLPKSPNQEKTAFGN